MLTVEHCRSGESVLRQRPAYQKILIWLGASLVALSVIAFVAVAFVIDWNQYKDTLAELTSERLGVRVELGGDLRLSFLPRPAVVANGVRLSPLGSVNGNAIATADQIGMRLGLFAALSGDLQLQSLELDGLSTKVEESEIGWRLEGWPAPVSDSEGPETTNSSTVVLDRIQITGGTINVRRLNGEQYRLEGLALDLSGSLPAGPLEWTGSVFLAQQSLQTEGKITPTRNGDLAIKTKVVAAGSELEFSGRAIGENALSGRVQFESVDISKLVDFATVVSGSGTKTAVPNVALLMDLQIEHASGITSLVSRRFSFDDSVGQIDLTIAGLTSAPNVTGRMTLGIVELDDILNAISGAPNDNQDAAVSDSIAADTNTNTLERLTGSVDLSIESVSLRGSVIQNVEATIALTGGSASVDRLQALLPGASRFQYLADGGGQGGSVTFDTSRLRHVLDWAGVQLPSEIPTGRLMTASLTTKLDVGGNAWSLNDLSGRFDTSEVMGQLRGNVSPFSLEAVDVSVDQLNLDAYWPENKVAASEGGALGFLDFNLSVGALRFRSEDYRDLNIRGGLTEASLGLEQASVAHENGTLRISGSRRQGTNGMPEIDAKISFKNWNFPILSVLYDERREYLAPLLKTAPYDGNVRLSGPETQIQTSLELKSTDRNFVLAGQIEGLKNSALRLQGSYQDSKPLELISASDMDFAVPHQNILPETTLSVVLDGALDDLTFSTSGGFLGGQLDVQGVSQDNSSIADITYSVEENATASVDGLLGDYSNILPTTGARRLRAKLGVTDTKVELSEFLVRAGGEEVSGSVHFQPVLGKKLGEMSGELAVLGVNLDRILTAVDDLQSSGTKNEKITGRALDTSPVVGVLTMELADVVLKGQSIYSDNATLEISDDQSFALDMGQGARLNANALDATVGFNPVRGAFTANLNTDAFDLGAFMRSLGAGRVMSGVVSLNTNLQADGTTLDAMLTTLGGDIAISGSAGSMHFLAVQELVNTINSAQNPTAFLSSIGGLLRNGQTDFAAIDSAVRLDGGVALVDKLNVSGNWGTLSLDGQVNFPADLMSLQGALNLTNPIGAPTLPVVYEGSLSSPTTRWTSRALERFAIAGIERRIRNRIFGELETVQGQSEAPPASPGTAILGTAFGLLDKLRQRQDERKREEAAKAAAAQGTEKQTP